MASINKTSRVKSEDYCKMQTEALAFGEKNDCSVKAIAIACGVDYATAHKVCNAVGREDGKGLSTARILQAVRILGKQSQEAHPYDFIQKYPGAHKKLRGVTTHHPARFNSVWKDGNSYLFFIRGHVLAVVDGKNHDWTVGTASRVERIFKIK